MNSKVKQAQKEGATVADISAGLAYSVIKNALFKVIKLSDPSDLGKHIVVQGGTFYNDAVLRSFETYLRMSCCPTGYRRYHGCLWCRTDCKRTLRRRYEKLLCCPLKKSLRLSIDTSMTRCKGCTQPLPVNDQQVLNGRPSYITGNRCERGIGKETNAENIPNLYDYKLHRTFDYEPLI